MSFSLKYFVGTWLVIGGLLFFFNNSVPKTTLEFVPVGNLGFKELKEVPVDGNNPFDGLLFVFPGVLLCWYEYRKSHGLWVPFKGRTVHKTRSVKGLTKGAKNV